MTHFKIMKKILLISILVSASPAFSDDQELIDGIVTDFPYGRSTIKKFSDNVKFMDKFFDMPTLYEILIQGNKNVFSYLNNGYWIDIGQLEDYKKANNVLGKEV